MKRRVTKEKVIEWKLAVGQTSTSKSRGKRSRASTSLAIPSDAFQIILERIDGLREVQNEHTDRMVAI